MYQPVVRFLSNQRCFVIRALSLLLLSAAACTAQTHPGRLTKPPQPHRQLKLVVGVVGEGGTVKFLPRVSIRVMPKGYADAEEAATAAYNAEMEKLRGDRDQKIRVLVDSRRSELESAEKIYHEELTRALQSVSLESKAATPDCVVIETVLRKIFGCDSALSSVGKTIQLSDGLRTFLASAQLTGPFEARTFKAASAPASLNRTVALDNVPLSTYTAVPEFSQAFEKLLKKERAKRKLPAGATIADQDGSAIVAKFVSDWEAAARKSNDYVYGSSALEKYGNLSEDIVPYSLDQMETAAKTAVKEAAEAPLRRYVETKDVVNAKYDALQRKADAEVRAGSELAESHRTEALGTAMKRTPPLQQASTSLQGEALVSVPASGAVLYAEDTTTDQHLRWTIPLVFRNLPAMLELTDANALPATPSAVASIAAAQEYPKAANLSDTDKAEYDLRYGSRLLKSWRTEAVLHDASVVQDQLSLIDSPLGFAFSVRATSTDVFNTLRMTDNDIASRFFKDIVAPYLNSLPTDLKSTGGSQAFQAVGISILGSKKSFADEYAVGDTFWINYVFRIADVESFASEKIDAQQLLDRAHISQDGVGRITVKLVSGQ